MAKEKTGSEASAAVPENAGIQTFDYYGVADKLADILAAGKKSAAARGAANSTPTGRGQGK